ncbi:hypothetical protein KM043_004772 [Ampulex compressa]|nr:hypothetical protein KM043_004772 [Ampulex compressa]
MVLLQYPTIDLWNLDSAGASIAGLEISSAAKDLLNRLLQPKPSLRLHSLLALQRIAFYMGHNLHDYMEKKESPFRLLGFKDLKAYQEGKMKEEFLDFDGVYP